MLRDQLVLICPGCQASGEVTAELDHCATCASTHLISRLGQVECLDCGVVREPVVACTGHRQQDDSLAEEVARALDRVLGSAGGSGAAAAGGKGSGVVPPG